MNDTHDKDVSKWYDTADIDKVVELLTRAGAKNIWVKRLVPNNNSKQQVYLARDTTDMYFLPLGVPTYSQGSSSKPRAGGPVIQHSLPWKWVTPNGVFEAPKTKMIYYPQYPEYRLSGFLDKCEEPPSELFNPNKRGHEDGRCLFLSPVKTVKGEQYVVGLAVGAQSPASLYVERMDGFKPGNLCQVPYKSSREAGEFSVLEEALLKLIDRDITPWRYLKDGTSVRPYHAPNEGGLTLEAELGVGENAIPGPDFDVWELKAVSQKTLDKRWDHTVTLFTPQPDKGWIETHSGVEFVMKYGHVSKYDASGNPIEYYFTTKDFNRPGENKETAKLDLKLIGFTNAKKFRTDGMIALIEHDTGELAAGWTYRKLIEHWQTKHNRAAYIPYITKNRGRNSTVKYGPLITLGVSTTFGLLLQAFNDGVAFYDPGDKAILKNGKWSPHARSQFRINYKKIVALYYEIQEIDLHKNETPRIIKNPAMSK